MDSYTTFPFCSGKHWCILCNKRFECEGIGYGHTSSQGYKCHGQYRQMCNNHSIATMTKRHKDVGDIS